METHLQCQRVKAVSCNLTTAASCASYPGAKLKPRSARRKRLVGAAVTQSAGEGDRRSVPLRAVLTCSLLFQGGTFTGGSPKPGSPVSFTTGSDHSSPQRVSPHSPICFSNRITFASMTSCSRDPDRPLGFLWCSGHRSPSLCTACPGRCPRAGPRSLQHRLCTEQALLHGS